MPRSLPAICLAAVSGLALAAPPPLAATLLASLAKAPPVSTPFVQVSYRSVLDQPLVVSGTMHWLGGDRLERDITQPFTETAKIGDGELSIQRGNGEIHRVSLARVPQAKALLAGFRALLGGELAGLEQDFLVSAAADHAHWVITLTPRSPALKQRLVAIMIDGTDAAPTCLTVYDSNGDSSITLVGVMATEGLHAAAPAQSVLAARCRKPQ